MVPFDVLWSHWRAEGHDQVSAETSVVWVFVLEKVLDLLARESVSDRWWGQNRVAKKKFLRAYRFVCGDSTSEKKAVIGA